MTTTSKQTHSLAGNPMRSAALDAPVQAPGRALKITGRVLLYITLVVAAIVFSLPWTWMILSALKSNLEIHSLPVTFFPKVWHWDNFILAFFPTLGGVRS